MDFQELIRKTSVPVVCLSAMGRENPDATCKDCLVACRKKKPRTLGKVAQLVQAHLLEAVPS